MCGIIGFLGRDNIAYELIMGLTALQHRGQDAAGITTFQGTFHTKKGLGLVSDVFEQKHLERLTGSMGIGHVRYTTQGGNELMNAQPIVSNYPFGIALVHNGNLTNVEQLNKTMYEEYHILPTTTSDSELALYTFASELAKQDLASIGANEVFKAVESCQKRLEGAYAIIAMIADHGLLAFCDPNGIRPLVFGKKETEEGTIYSFASETVCFESLGYETIRDLKPGEIVYIDKNKQVHSSYGLVDKQHFCVFEFIYFAREDSTIFGRLVAGQRVKMGRVLAEKMKEKGLQPDIVIDVPNSGYFAASGLAEALGVPHRRGLVKNSYIGRSFISPYQSERENIVRRKLNPIRKTIAGRKIAVVDDSIVRGTTSKRIVKILREAGAKEIYFISAAPPVLSPCIYGIDMSVRTELIATQMSEEEICNYIGADALVYQSMEDIKKVFDFIPICDACLTGDYPTQNADKLLAKLETSNSCK